MIYVGTSGFSYKEWKGVFYPDKLAAKDYLSFYSQHFSTTEINNTFYRSPSESTSTKWAEQVPEAFRFTLKINRKITHYKKLKDVEDEMDWFLKGAAALGEKLGTLLVQLPPYLREDRDLLEHFLGEYSDRAPLALEFRHPSWSSDQTLQLLESHGAALVVTCTDEDSGVRAVTAPFLYVRLRKSQYSEEDLKEWARWVRSQNKDAFVYLKHSTQAPRLVERLTEHLSI